METVVGKHTRGYQMADRNRLEIIGVPGTGVALSRRTKATVRLLTRARARARSRSRAYDRMDHREAAVLAQETETDGNKASANRRYPTGNVTRANNARPRYCSGRRRPRQILSRL